jgi:hypothetical protein
MSQAANEPIEGQGSGEEIIQGTPDESQEGTGLNPAWNDLMQVVPSQLHSLVTPHLQKWDQNYQEGIGKVHSEYESWKPFKEAGIAPEQVTYGLQLLDAIEQRPQEIFDALKNYLQIDDNQEVNDQTLEDEQGQESTPIDLASIPEFQQMAEMVKAMAELTVQQNSAQAESQADTELEQEFESAKQQFGEFDEKWVITQMLANDGLTLEQAVQSYQEFVKEILTNANRPGPRVLSAGGGNPSLNANPSQLDDKGRRNMVAEMLAASKQQ